MEKGEVGEQPSRFPESLSTNENSTIFAPSWRVDEAAVGNLRNLASVDANFAPSWQQRLEMASTAVPRSLTGNARPGATAPPSTTAPGKSHEEPALAIHREETLVKMFYVGVCHRA